MCSLEYEILRIWNSATADVRSSCMLILENILMCKETGLQVRQIVGLMYITVKVGINHISRVTVIGIFHVYLKPFTNTARMHSHDESSTNHTPQCRSKAWPIPKYPAHCDNLQIICKSSFWKLVRQCLITSFYKWRVKLQSLGKKCCHYPKNRSQEIKQFPHIPPPTFPQRRQSIWVWMQHLIYSNRVDWSLSYNIYLCIASVHQAVSSKKPESSIHFFTLKHHSMRNCHFLRSSYPFQWLHRNRPPAAAWDFTE